MFGMLIHFNSELSLQQVALWSNQEGTDGMKQVDMVDPGYLFIDVQVVFEIGEMRNRTPGSEKNH